MKSLLLVSRGYGHLPSHELDDLESTDQYPRVSLFNRTINADLLDDRSIREGNRGRPLYRLLPVPVSQVVEAFLVKARYDAVVSWSEHLGIPLAFLFKITRSKTPHVALFSWISGERKKKALRMVSSHIDKIILMSSVQHTYALNEIGLPPSKVTLLRWPIDTQFWRPIENQTDTICSVGREMRDYATLIESLRNIAIPCHIAANIFVGKKDAWIATLKKPNALPAHITVGKKSYVELRDLYARSRFLVMPLLSTDTDNGTTSILEAMAMGKPVICSRTKGQVDVIQEGKTGFFVPVGDVRTLRERIEYLWNHPDVATRMGLAARRFVEENHNLDTFVQQVKSVLQEVVGGREAEDHRRKSIIPTTQGTG